MKQSGLIHSVIITKDNGTILLSVYYDGSLPAERGKFEHDLYLQSRPEWVEIKPSEKESTQVDQFKAHVSLVDDKSVVYKKVNDVVFFITGSGEYSELILNEVLNVIINGILAMCPKKRLWNTAFDDDNTYGKIMAILDQIVFMGHYCQSDILTADSRAKMKAIK